MSNRSFSVISPSLHGEWGITPNILYASPPVVIRVNQENHQFRPRPFLAIGACRSSLPDSAGLPEGDMSLGRSAR
jgi:hypothetical protein